MRLHALSETKGGEVRDYPSFSASDRSAYGFDALVIPPNKRPQILVEVKFRPKLDPGSIIDALRALEDLVAAFEATFGVTAHGWLIVVADTIKESDEELANATASLYERLTVSLIRPDEIGSLELPE